MKIRIKFVPRDLWLGIYKAPPGVYMSTIHVKGEQVKYQGRMVRNSDKNVPAVESRHELYICVVPMFPIVLSWSKMRLVPQNDLRARLLALGRENERIPIGAHDLVSNVMDAIRKHGGRL